MSVKPYTDYVCVHRYNYTAGAMSFVTKIVTNKTHLGSNLKRRPNLMEWSQLLQFNPVKFRCNGSNLQHLIDPCVWDYRLVESTDERINYVEY